MKLTKEDRRALKAFDAAAILTVATWLKEMKFPLPKKGIFNGLGKPHS